MPNKPTKKDRREASKQARFEAKRLATKQRRRRFFYGGLGAAAFIALIVGIVLFGGKAVKVDTAALNRAAVAAGCTSLQSPPNLGGTHVAQGTTVQYDSDPPTSGSHYLVPGIAPGPTGVHTTPIQNEIQVHNLEHGHVGIQYADPLQASIRDSMESFTRSHDTTVFMAPRQFTGSPGTVVAFTSWGKLISCSSPTNASAVEALAKLFYGDFQGLSPEIIPGTPLQGG